MVDHNARLAQQFEEVQLAPSVGLLFPDADAPVLTQLPARERPQELVVLDGTWHHAKTLLRDIPRLGTLRRFRLAPTSPGQYRIRREPTDESLSTIEAIVAALRSLEPNTQGLDALLTVFDNMIDRQLANPKSGWRKNQRRRRDMPNVPRNLTGDLGNVVVAYGDQERIGSVPVAETAAKKPGPIFWNAQRLRTGEYFQCVIDCPSLRDRDFCDRLQLAPDAMNEAVSRDQFRMLWRNFTRDGEQLAVYQPGTAKLLENVGADFLPVILLKSISLGDAFPSGTLSDFLATQGIHTTPAGPSRAARRLAESVAYVKYLNQCFKRSVS